MNYNATVGTRQPPGRGPRVKHVSNVQAVGQPYPAPQFMPPTFDVPQQQQQQQQQIIQTPFSSQSQFSSDGVSYSGINDPTQNQNYVYSQAQMSNSNMSKGQFQNYPNLPPQQPPMMTPSQGLPNNTAGNFPQQFTVFQQPIVQDMAMQYGQKLADQGKQLVESHIEKYVPVTRLKYYFAVDNKYVINKLRLLFFPFTHKDWFLKYDQDNPVQPRYDINAVDLYIPAMAYITYVVLAGLLLGMQNRFTPEQLGIQASSALAYSLFELVVYSITLYVANIPTHLKTLDLLAFSGYKYAIIVGCILISILFHKTGYYIALIYCSLSLSFFLLRSLKTKVLNDTSQQPTSGGGITYDAYGGPQTQQFDYSTGRKRKLYFLFLIVGFQIFLSFWLSKHLISS